MQRLRNQPFIKELMKDRKFKAEYNALASEFELSDGY